jgi:hypothetical protein
LCAQLARAESPIGFERKGAPDAGVECYTVHPDNTEWGWQAKYFDDLGDAQWQQLDSSVKTALSKHPKLVKYFICVPLDRPDARIEGRRSAKERWDDHVTKWQGWAFEIGMTVEFVYWGSHELLERLSRPEHVGRVRLFFDVRRFDAAWFGARLDEALQTAGPRYTPEIHVDLPIAKELDAFGRTDTFFSRVKAGARNIRRQLRHVEYAQSKPELEAVQGSISDLLARVRSILASFEAIAVDPIGALALKRIAEEIAAVESISDEIQSALLLDQERQSKPSSRSSKTMASSNSSPHRELRYALSSLDNDLYSNRRDLERSHELAECKLVLLTGTAGTGKTHLLCDVARQRNAGDRPTVLLMGQRFVSTEHPWAQVLQQLDMTGLTAEEFVGALEAAAQASNCRALLLIDAVNEGSGRNLWPSHLAAFLAPLEKSPWIGVLLSVRSSYEEIIVPENVRSHAVPVVHRGFAEHEYDATKTFFVHYTLELPSTPLLAPEFQNPLFLKTLCQGLSASGQRRLPRGFQGLSFVFELYLSAINKRLATVLGFNPKSSLVTRALSDLAAELVLSEDRWLGLHKAEQIVNALLPGREFERSLYRNLVSEGILVEEMVWPFDRGGEEVVFIGYDRLADHLIAKTLIEAHVDKSAPEVAFTTGAPLGFFSDDQRDVAPGLIEAMCVQIPECASREFPSLVPQVPHWKIGDAFRQSVVWRSPTAFTDETREVLNALIRSDHDWEDTLEVLLTVATLPDHPFNAYQLDKMLRRETLPDRDQKWSIHVHRAWGRRTAVERLVDWAWAQMPTTSLDQESVDLCAIALAGMFTTSNRFLRDRATKALVCILTGRLGAVLRLVERFADVNDPYVVERVFAVAYGAVMRSHEPDQVGAVASFVYSRVFAGGSPPPHILLRDYARGIVERAIHLEAPGEVDVKLIRPPYNSEWPTIPSEEEIKPYLPDWLRDAGDEGPRQWGRKRIASSVLDDDFARYVIGTTGITNWLSLRIAEPQWKSAEELTEELLGQLSADERAAWEKYKAAEDRDAALAELQSIVAPEQAERVEVLVSAKKENLRPPRFDLRSLQRYILWRVFDLGWTTERFGVFDRTVIGYDGRAAHKAERIGKKYQWIALHEILALVADHFQYREEFRGPGNATYCGPWQDWLRNIDPSCTIRATQDGTSWGGHVPAWWGGLTYNNWEIPGKADEWTLRTGDFPNLKELLSVRDPIDGSRWLNLQAYFHWDKPTQVERERTETEQRQVWYIITGYLIRTGDVETFMSWAKGVSFWGRWMPEPAELHQIYLGEHGWAPAARYFEQPYYGERGWHRPGNDCPAEVRVASVEYVCEAQGFDCSVDGGFTLRLPASDLTAGLDLRWSGIAADYVDAKGHLTAFDPTAHGEGPASFLIRQDALEDFLRREGLTMCWAIRGEKRVIGPERQPGTYFSLEASGAYALSVEGLTGFLNFKPAELSY